MISTLMWPSLRPATLHQGQDSCHLLLILLQRPMGRRGRLDGIEIVAFDQFNGGVDNHTQSSALLDCFGS
jgi:hypothetical protein